MTRSVTLWRVRWRHPNWQPNTATRVRLFHRLHNARNFATSKAMAGHRVQLARADGPIRFEAVEDWAGAP